MTDAAAYFDEAALTYEGALWETFGSDMDLTAQMAATSRHARRIIAALEPGPDAVLLDLGCGTGRLTKPIAAELAPTGARVIGLDVSPRMVAWARKFNNQPNAEFGITDGLGLKDLGGQARFGVVDGWWSMLLFQHLPHTVTSGLLSALAARSRPGARGMFQYVEGADEGPLSHQASQAQVETWCAGAGLEVIRIASDDDYSPDWKWVEVLR